MSHNICEMYYQEQSLKFASKFINIHFEVSYIYFFFIIEGHIVYDSGRMPVPAWQVRFLGDTLGVCDPLVPLLVI